MFACFPATRPQTGVHVFFSKPFVSANWAGMLLIAAKCDSFVSVGGLRG
jgi:hypothetical protein